MHLALDDFEQRELALDTARSFIVQAPAGSGKTELLIQRYLGLLRLVDEPEQIVAITFTRKAAAEMRARIGAALESARAGEVTASPHRQNTLRLAASALQRDDERGWEITTNPQRLRIETLDALNSGLSRQLPVLSRGAAGASVVDDSSEFYELAARRCIESLSRSSDGIAQLERVLPEYDNDVSRLERMLVDLLGRRDQWIQVLADSDLAALRTYLSAALNGLIASKLGELVAAIPRNVLERLAPLVAHAATNATSEALRENLRAWKQGGIVPGATAQDLRVWRGIAGLVLTQNGSPRRQLTKREGFGPEHKQLKQELLDVINELCAPDAILERLVDVGRLPDSDLSESDFELLGSLRRILLLAVAQLQVTFSVAEAVDFTELAFAARYALGAADDPSELMLALDRRIQHVLVDEFQDTSQAQFELLEQLTAGWQPGDGRTMFLVGDPMQSIYRFRNADMSLFLRAREQGISDVHCEPVTLSANFRCVPAIVDWVNETFAKVFPSNDDLELGAAQFHPSLATRKDSPANRIQYHSLVTDSLDDELDRIVDIIRLERTEHPDSSIGVLVQSRSHLAGFRAKLQRYSWPVRAVEIDALHTEPFAQDLIALARALSHYADRIAWLAVLRAPWCGLTWSELERLVGDDESRTVWELIHDDEQIVLLTEDSRVRLHRLRAVLERAVCDRGKSSFARWIERTWLALGGPESLRSDAEHDKVPQFFASLAIATARGDVLDPVDLEVYFRRPQREPDEPGSGSIDIMTIHRAKGLEFDTVILSSLNRLPRRPPKSALHVSSFVELDGQVRILLAPETKSPSKLSSYIAALEARRDAAERARLLYVAATRARERLHLVWGLASHDADPASGSLLATIWPRVMDAPREEMARTPNGNVESVAVSPKLRRFAAIPAAAEKTLYFEPPRETVEYEWVGDDAARVGTVVHKYLHLLSRDLGQSWTIQNVRELETEYRRELELLGVESMALDSSARRVVTALESVLSDSTGRWILEPRESAASEVPLSVVRNGRFRRLRLDRTFIDDGVRWIIDYKTGSHEGGRVDAFLDSEVERYRPQLEEYARAMSEWESIPIRVGLYFPMLQAFRHWSPSPGSIEDSID